MMAGSAMGLQGSGHGQGQHGELGLEFHGDALSG
jgi:hypothetical protein